MGSLVLPKHKREEWGGGRNATHSFLIADTLIILGAFRWLQVIRLPPCRAVSRFSTATETDGERERERGGIERRQTEESQVKWEKSSLGRRREKKSIEMEGPDLSYSRDNIIHDSTDAKVRIWEEARARVCPSTAWYSQGLEVCAGQCSVQLPSDPPRNLWPSHCTFNLYTELQIQASLGHAGVWSSYWQAWNGIWFHMLVVGALFQQFLCVWWYQPLDLEVLQFF